MTLKNLLGLSLDAVEPDKAHTAKLLAAAERNIADAKLQGLSTENRFGVPGQRIGPAGACSGMARGKSARPSVMVRHDAQALRLRCSKP
ncbi:MAG: hypothetical protein Q8K96_17785 [Rubrivivax sp.]|nr:hypothetical protein [Rubrivivax sp.]